VGGVNAPGKLSRSGGGLVGWWKSPTVVRNDAVVVWKKVVIPALSSFPLTGKHSLKMDRIEANQTELVADTLKNKTAKKLITELKPFLSIPLTNKTSIETRNCTEQTPFLSSGDLTAVALTNNQRTCRTWRDCVTLLLPTDENLEARLS
jgi:hypothetical protein